MPLITFNGPIGSGGPEIGLEVSNKLNIDYVDRLILAEAAKRIGATVQAVVRKEQKLPRTRDRIGRFAQNLLERSAMSGAGGEPYFGPGIEVLLSRDYYSSSTGETIIHSVNSPFAFLEGYLTLHFFSVRNGQNLQKSLEHPYIVILI